MKPMTPMMKHNIWIPLHEKIVFDLAMKKIEDEHNIEMMKLHFSVKTNNK